MVTSFRPRDPFVHDDSVLNTVRPISHLPELYGQVAEYQLQNAEQRIRHMLREVRDAMKVGSVKASSIKSFLSNEIAILKHLDEQIIDEGLVKKGYMADACWDSMKVNYN
jgi:hypothetical protein